jgi:hypothetical protein
MAKRIEDATALRDAIVPAILAGGIFTRLTTKCPCWAGGGFTISYRTPMENGVVRITPVSWEGVSWTEAGMSPFGLDIWPTGENKVLNMEWHDRAGAPVLVSFRRGPWEQRLLEFIRSG